MRITKSSKVVTPKVIVSPRCHYLPNDIQKMKALVKNSHAYFSLVDLLYFPFLGLSLNRSAITAVFTNENDIRFPNEITLDRLSKSRKKHIKHIAAHEYQNPFVGRLVLGSIYLKTLKNKPSLAYAYSILG